MGGTPAEPRQCAARIVAAVLGGRSLADAEAGELARVADDADRALTRELAFGTLRWLPALRSVAGGLLRKPLRERDRDVEALLLIGLYQLRETRIADHAAVAETAGTCRRLGKDWAVGLVNGVLRNYLRRADALDAALGSEPEYRHAHPEWLIDAFRGDWPDAWEHICAAGNARPPMHLRVNMARSTRETFLQSLTAAGIDAAASPVVATGITLATPCAVGHLPGFGDGSCSVQDLAAQCAAPMLAPEPGDRVLDACAAPGGKTAHLLEFQPAIASLLAIDIDPGRVESIRTGLSRLCLEAELRAADACNPDSWWDGRPFDRILIDAPCSGTGVIRRHPDIKTLRRHNDVATMAERQDALLEALWPLLAPGGKLLYATCSVLREENDARIRAFLGRHADARLEPPALPFARDTGAGWQILPGEQAMDGFFYAPLVRD